MFKTFDSNFKGAVFTYLAQALSWNKQNVKNFTLKICHQRFLLNQAVFYFPRDFFLIDEINHLISILSANGVISHLISEYADIDYLNVKQTCFDPSPISLEQISGIFFVLIVCLAVAVFCFILELSFSSLQRSCIK